MPYELIKNPNKKDYKLINKETGKIVSKHTNPKKAYKQIQAIHINKNISNNNNIDNNKMKMKPSHRIRNNVEKLKGRKIQTPDDRYILRLTKKLLKQEEINGGGFWSDAWDVTKNILSMPADILENVPFAKTALEYAVPELKPFIEPGLALKKMVYGDNTNQYLKDAFDTSDDKPETPKEVKPLEPRQTQNTVERVLDNQIQDIYERSTPADTQQIPRSASDLIYDPYGTAKSINVDDLSQHISPIMSTSFPITLDIDPRDEPLGLREFLLRQGMAGQMVSKNEYDAIIKKQKPERYLNFPGKYYSYYPYNQ